MGKGCTGRKSLYLYHAALIGLVAFTLCLSSCQPAPDNMPRPVTPSENKLGMHLLLDDGRNHWPTDRWPEHMQYAGQIVGKGGYVTQLVRLDDLDPARWQLFMDLCAEHHLIPIIRLATVYDREANWWVAPSPNRNGGYRKLARQYARFISSLDWPTEEHYIIVGNEPNHGNEWGGQPDPAAYARFLIDVADAIHEADPGARVLNAGFDTYSPHTGGQPFLDGNIYLDSESFMDGMVAAEPDVFQHIDAWASHAYPMGPFTEGPWQQVYQVDYVNGAANPDHVEPPPGVPNRGVNGHQWELYKLSTYGIENLPVFITETGWRHGESVDPDSPDNGRPLPDAETAAAYIDLALWGNDGHYPQYPETGWTPWLSDPNVVGVTFFALDGVPSEWGHTNWLVLDSSGGVIDAYWWLAGDNP